MNQVMKVVQGLWPSSKCPSPFAYRERLDLCAYLLEPSGPSGPTIDFCSAPGFLLAAPVAGVVPLGVLLRGESSSDTQFTLALVVVSLAITNNQSDAAKVRDPTLWNSHCGATVDHVAARRLGDQSVAFTWCE
jgi:hypothetical protein